MHLPEGVDYGYKGGIPGLYDEKGRLIKKAEDLTPQQLSDFERDYKRRRGSAQINVDKQVQQIEKKSQEEARNKRKPGQPAPVPGPGRQPAPPAAPAPTSTKPAPAPVRQPAPQASPVAQYMKAAAAARKSGDPAEMARVRDMGMKIWSSTPANQKLAAAAAERERIRGTAQTDNPLMKDMRSRLPLTPSVQAPAVKDLGLGQQSLSQNPNAAIAATPKPRPTPQQITTAYKTPQQVAPVKPTGASDMSTQATKIAPKTDQYKKDAKPLLKQSYEYDAYDLVLEYLISEGYVDTQSEAEFLMSYMDAECIHNIVEQNEFITERIGSLLKLLPKKNLVLGKVLKKLGLPVAAGAATVAVMRPDLTKKVIDNIKGTTQNAKQSAIDNLDKLRNMMPDLSADDKDKDKDKDKEDKDKDKGKGEPSTSGGMSPLASPPPEVVSPARIARQYNRIRSDEIRTGDNSSTSSRYLSRELSRLQKNNEAYDIVLDYLLSEGHADTVDEAHYVMLQMDAEYIQNIVNG